MKRKYLATGAKGNFYICVSFHSYLNLCCSIQKYRFSIKREIGISRRVKKAGKSAAAACRTSLVGF